MRLYLAGPLFTDAEKRYNSELAATLRRAGHAVFLPQEHQPTAGNHLARRTFAEDVSALRNAQAVVAILDGSDVDSGTAWECGFAYGQGKYVFGLRTDVRQVGEYDQPINLMLTGGLEDYATSVHELVRQLDEVL